MKRSHVELGFPDCPLLDLLHRATKSGSYRWFSWTAVPEGELIYAVAPT